MRTLLISLFLIGLLGCTLSERKPGMDKAEYTTFKAEVREKADACQASEQDLLPQSVKAITYGNTERIIEIYLSIYDNPDLPENMQAESLYQIGLIHMNEYNEQRNDDQALVYFNRLKTQYPQSGLCTQVDKRMVVIDSRKVNAKPLDEPTLLALRAAIKERAQKCVAEESALLTESISAISQKQAHKVIQGYLKLAKDSELNQASREQALYQVGLIYMNTANVHRDDRLALHYLQQLLVEYPDSTLCNQARNHIITINDRIH